MIPIVQGCCTGFIRIAVNFLLGLLPIWIRIAKNKNKKYHNKKEEKKNAQNRKNFFCFFLLLFVFNVLFYLDIESSHKFHQMQSITCNFLRNKMN